MFIRGGGGGGKSNLSDMVKRCLWIGDGLQTSEEELAIRLPAACITCAHYGFIIMYRLGIIYNNYIIILKY